MSIPRDWTDFEAQQAEEPPAPPGRLLDIKGLREIARLIGSIKAEIHSAEAGDGDDP